MRLAGRLIPEALTKAAELLDSLGLELDERWSVNVDHNRIIGADTTKRTRIIPVMIPAVVAKFYQSRAPVTIAMTIIVGQEEEGEISAEIVYVRDNLVLCKWSIPFQGAEGAQEAFQRIEKHIRQEFGNWMQNAFPRTRL